MALALLGPTGDSGSNRDKWVLRVLRVFWGLEVKVQGSGFRVQGSGFRVQGFGFRV